MYLIVFVAIAAVLWFGSQTTEDKCRAQTDVPYAKCMEDGKR